MTKENTLAGQIASGNFIVTAELLPKASTEKTTHHIDKKITAVNVADNPHGPVMSSLSGALSLLAQGIEPVYQLVTRDRNRIALMSDLMGAASLGIKNVLCLSGYHQALTGCPESTNVYDIDSIQLIDAIKKMNNTGTLYDGTTIQGGFSMQIGAVANPFLKPMELNMIRATKKVAAGAQFIQTQAVFDMAAFQEWMEAMVANGLTDQTAILAGVLPLSSAQEAEDLNKKFTDFAVPDEVIARMKSAGDEKAQQKEGIKICAETIKAIKQNKEIKGVHILSGGKEDVVPEVIAASGL